MGGSELKEMAIAAIRGVMLANPAVAQYADDVIGIIEGRKVAIDASADPSKTASALAVEGLRPVMKPTEVAGLLRVHVKTLERYARDGRLVRVKVSGRKRGIGYTRESVERWLKVGAGASD